MSRWVLRAAIFFCVTAMLTAGALLLFKLEVAEKSVLVTLLWLTITAFVTFGVLVWVGVWWKARKDKLARKP
jgi:Trk-type K+ transport system membrane component